MGDTEEVIGSSSQQRLPNFLIIGAAKSGTTAFFEALCTHPDIYGTNPKEPGFFAFEGSPTSFAGPWGPELRPESHLVSDLASYEALYAGRRDERVAGEASVVYLYSPEAPLRIAELVPDAKLIVLLRNPADRAFSHYTWYKEVGQETLSLPDAIAACPEREALGWEWGWQYVKAGMYATQLRRYLAHFPRSALRIIIYEDFVADPVKIYRETFDFLGVDSTFVPSDLGRKNVSVRRKGLARTIRRLRASLGPNIKRLLPSALRNRMRNMTAKSSPRPGMAPVDRQHLVNLYREEIRDLETLIDRDLGAWSA